jgi:hypothetical protein
MMAAVIIIITSSEQKMASNSGNFFLLRNLNMGSNTMLIKNAMSNGIMICCPSIITIPRITSPISSIDLLTVSGSACIRIIFEII